MRPDPTHPASSSSCLQSGFTLIETVVALMVAAVLCLSLLGGQSRSVQVTDYANEYWQHVDMAHELLAHGGFEETGGRQAWPEREDLSWSIEVEPSIWSSPSDTNLVLAEVIRATTTTHVGKSSMEWIRLAPPEDR